MARHRTVWFALGSVALLLGACIGDPTADSTPPTVVITSPAPNATVSGVVSISTLVTDNLGIEVVRFYAGTTLLGEDGIAPYEWLWNTTTRPAGAVQLQVVAVDLAGNTGEALRTVTVNNGPQ